MTFFAVYDDAGAIVQGSKVYDPTGYADRLRDLNYRFVEQPTFEMISPDEWRVVANRLKKRTAMCVTVDKIVIQAGGADAAVLTGAPKNVAFSVSVMGSPVWNGTLPDGELELSVPVPGLYEVTFTKWPFKAFAVQIEATA